jgi:hypothetical protein
MEMPASAKLPCEKTVVDCGSPSATIVPSIFSMQVSYVPVVLAIVPVPRLTDREAPKPPIGWSAKYPPAVPIFLNNLALLI